MPNSCCYMCSEAPTSVEHVPPLCLFPEKKDLPSGVDLRKQLITVPSCDEHNTSKSKDDEYILYALVLNIPNNETATNQFFTKIQRAIERNPALINGFAQTTMPILAEDRTTGQIQRTLAVKVDRKRLNRALEMIARALYFHHFKAHWPGAVSVFPHFLLWLTEPNAAELNQPLAGMALAVEQLMEAEPLHGANPEVFCYQVVEGKGALEKIMFLRIYGGSHITVLFQKQG
jgi:hypothetical protein